MTHPGGRPLKFQSVEELQSKIDAYFAECDPHWIDEEYYDYPDLDIEESLEDQPNGGSLKRRRNKDYKSEQILKTRKVMSKQIPYTITGLALALDTTRETLLDYEDGDRDIEPDNTSDDGEELPKFSDTIKKAKLKIHNYAENRLFENNPTGTIFNLKNNYGWKDKTETDVTTNGKSINPYSNLTDEQLKKLADDNS